MSTIDQRSRWLEPGPLITLYELDLTGLRSAFTGDAGPISRFHDGISQGSNTITFKGNEYTPYPIRAESFEWNTRGTLPRPKMSVSNIGSAISALLREFDDFIGAKITVRRTFGCYIAGGSEAGNPQEFTPQIFVVDRKTGETNTIVSFDLATGMDAEGILLPRRQVLATACTWCYRGTECGYTGIPKTNRLGEAFTLNQSHGEWNKTTPYHQNDYVYVLVNGIQVWAVAKVANTGKSIYNENYWMLDACLKKHGDCETHFGENVELPFGGFPGANKLE